MESDKKYWIALFTLTTWQEFVDSNKNVFGFNSRRSTSLEFIKPGDYLICYLSKVSRIIGLYEVETNIYFDKTIIWQSGIFPMRLKAKPIFSLSPETAVQLFDLKDELSFFNNLKNPCGWTFKVRRSLTQWTKNDGEIVYKALKQATINKVAVPITEKKMIILH